MNDSSVDTNVSLFSALQKFKVQSDTSTFKQVSNGVYKYYLPEVSNFIAPRRFSVFEKEKAVELTKELILTKGSVMLDVIDCYCSKNSVSGSTKRQVKHYVCKFIDWCINENILLQEPKRRIDKKDVNQLQMYQRGVVVKEKKTTLRNGKYKTTKLSTDYKDYLSDYEKKYPDLSYNSLVEIIKGQLAEVLLETDEYQKIFEAKNLKPNTIESKIQIINQLYGYFYQVKGDLSEITFRKQIDVIDIYPRIQEFDSIEKYYIEKQKRYESCLDSGKTIIADFNNFIASRERNISTSRGQRILDVYISIAQYLYKDISDEIVAARQEDIPLVKILINHRRRLKLKNGSDNVIILEKKITSWSEILSVFVRLKLEANTKILASKCTAKSHLSDPYQYRAREDVTIAKSLMKFLALAFLVLIPPDRQQVYREMRINEQFIYGYFDDNKKFVSEDFSIPKDYCWFYIKLSKDDYKTGKYYGESIMQVPNPVFNDSSCFYDYIFRWLNHERQLLVNRDCIHNFFFLGLIAGKPLSGADFTRIIKRPMSRIIHTPVTPHTLRTIYRTHIDNIASNLELESTAFCMKHDVNTAKKSYTFNLFETKYQPALKLLDRVNQEIFHDREQVEN